MPIDSTHPEYKKNAPFWQKCRDTIAGEDQVKEQGPTYLPRLGGQDQGQYDAYLKRAVFVGIMGRTVDALVGAVFRKPIKIDIEGKEKGALDLASHGHDFGVFAKHVFTQTLAVGRHGAFVDFPREGGNGDPYLVEIPAESITNWVTQDIDGQSVPVAVVIKEMVADPAEADDFEHKTITRYRLLLLQNGIYEQHIYQQNDKEKWEIVEIITPKVQGMAIKYIPFVFFPGNQADVSPPPLLGLANLNLSHYRSYADLEHGRHYTALPTPFVTGLSSDSIGKLMIGSGSAWVIENENAKVGFLEFTGQGLGSLERAIGEKEKLMATMGARFLVDPQKRSVESAETHTIRRSGEDSVLATLARSVSADLSKLATWWAEFRGIKKPITVTLNTDYTAATMDTKAAKDLLDVYHGGAMSLPTLLHNYQSGELLPPGISAEDEQDRIAIDGPADS